MDNIMDNDKVPPPPVVPVPPLFDFPPLAARTSYQRADSKFCDAAAKQGAPGSGHTLENGKAADATM